MKGTHLKHIQSGHAGKVDATAVEYDESIKVRFNDQWFYLDECDKVGKK